MGQRDDSSGRVPLSVKRLTNSCPVDSTMTRSSKSPREPVSRCCQAADCARGRSAPLERGCSPDGADYGREWRILSFEVTAGSRAPGLCVRRPSGNRLSLTLLRQKTCFGEEADNLRLWLYTWAIYKLQVVRDSGSVCQSSRSESGPLRANDSVDDRKHWLIRPVSRVDRIISRHKKQPFRRSPFEKKTLSPKTSKSDIHFKCGDRQA